MANTISALKRIRIAERRTVVNRQRRSRLRITVRAMRRLLAAKDLGGAQAALPNTFSTVDKAAKLGVIKKNTASRYKSRMHRRLKALEPAAA